MKLSTSLPIVSIVAFLHAPVHATVAYPSYETYQADAFVRAATSCMARSGMTKRCAKLLEEATRFDPDRRSIQLLLGQAYLALDDYSRAQSVFAALLREDPDLRPALLGLSVIYIRTGELDLALQKIKSFESAGGHDPEAAYIRAEIAIRQGEESKALAQLRQAIREGFDQRDLVRNAPFWEHARRMKDIQEWLNAGEMDNNSPRR